MARFSGGTGSGSSVPGASGPQGLPGADGADALWNFVGEYDNGADYGIGDVVTYLGGTYYRVLPENTGYAPGTEYWTTIAEPGINGDPLDFLAVASSIIPTQDNMFDLGDSQHRWKSISIGEGTIYITDAVTGAEAGFTISDGVFFIDGIAQAQLPNLAVTNLIFSDETTQTTAAVPQVNSDWNASTGLAEILNKPDIAAEAAPTETTFVVNGGTLGTQPTFTGAPLFSGSYVKSGPMVHFQVQVDMDNITNFGTGQYYVDLPFPAKYGYQVKEGCLHDISTGKQYAIGGHVYAGNSQLALTFTNSNGQDEAFDNNSPVALSTQDNFHIAGTYITD